MNEELQIKISADIADLKKEIEKGQKQVSSFGDKAKAVGSAVGKALKGAGQVVGTAVKAMGVALVAGATALVGLAESTKEYRQEQAKLITAFETAGASAETAKNTYNDLYRVLGDSGQATEASSHLAQLTTNEKDLAEWTNVCQGVYATFGASLPIEALTEASNETAKVGQVTGALADALNWAGISEDAFNEQLASCNTEAEREKLIRETLNGVYSEASAKYEENAKGLLNANEAQAKLTDSLAQLGAVAEPIVTIFKSFGADILTNLLPAFTQIGEGLQDVINGVDGGADKLAGGISNLLMSIVNTIVSMLPTIIQVGITLITSLIQGIVSALPDVITAIVEAIPALIEGILQAVQAIIEALPSIIETIVNALPTLIPQLVTGIVQLIVMLCESIGAIIQPLIDALPDVIISIVNAIMSNLPALISGLITLIMAIVQAIPQIIQALVDALPTVISSIISGLLNCLPQIIAGLIQVVIGIVVALPQIFGSLIQGVINILAGIWDGLADVFGNIGAWFGEKFGGAVTAIKNAFSGIGNWFAGIWNGIKNAFSAVGSWFKNIFNTAVNGVKTVFSGITSFFSGVWNSIKNIFSKVGSTIGDAITGAVKKAVNGVLSMAVKIINGFIGAINLAISVINAIPGVSIKKLTKLEAPQLEKGGVLKKGQVGILEGNGAEAVVPLEKNTGWLDKIAERLNARTGDGAPIYLQVDGRTFAEITLDTLNELTRQRGRLDLILG